MFLDYQSQNLRTIVSCIFNSLSPMMCNNLMTYLKSNNIQKDGFTTQVLVKAMTASNINNSSEFANNYKTLRFSPSRHFELQNYFTELKKFANLILNLFVETIKRPTDKYFWSPNEIINFTGWCLILDYAIFKKVGRWKWILRN